MCTWMRGGWCGTAIEGVGGIEWGYVGLSVWRSEWGSGCEIMWAGANWDARVGGVRIGAWARE
jgi:hypothetical protein